MQVDVPHLRCDVIKTPLQDYRNGVGKITTSFQKYLDDNISAGSNAANSKPNGTSAMLLVLD
jgi:hypothetical protein